ncbi:MAG TPA: hypothetical protein VFV78_08060 [Vicinamibacterales bacterium]|nr:hypothetical protein [Vicinamibacterales bacterium]
MTLGVAALAGLALAVSAAHSTGRGGPPGHPRLVAGQVIPSPAGARTRGTAGSSHLGSPARAATTGRSALPSGHTSPVPAAPAMAADEMPDGEATPTTAAAAAPVAASTPASWPAASAESSTAGRNEITPAITIKKDAVIGIRLDRAITTETARVDDRVTARVARDVLVDDRPALAAGTCVQGHVAIVERGQRAFDGGRIGIRFTAIALGDGRRVPIQTEVIFRESEPADDAAPTGSRAALSAFLSAGATARPARAHPVPANLTRRDVRIPAGSLLTIKLTAAVVIEK